MPNFTLIRSKTRISSSDLAGCEGVNRSPVNSPRLRRSISKISALLYRYPSRQMTSKPSIAARVSRSTSSVG
ncbi:Nucleotidyltransferase/DNA polymerase involved in DNA repair [Pseudomonas syringae pv. actinidiae]|uniref:Nucleotidyltransferase/DNA polymerase involved in DNA repair n=1 Tax=Pseudomonas syringae pv. actinidiae TaxID=103796 RepID=A0AAN4Q7A9_PSESF|nr:Nucleotidyltransferase/DNA polymerase involved in DNA repair [Pseudomonas syringae pv. actinidiae]